MKLEHGPVSDEWPLLFVAVQVVNSPLCIEIGREILCNQEVVIAPGNRLEERSVRAGWSKVFRCEEVLDDAAEIVVNGWRAKRKGR